MTDKQIIIDEVKCPWFNDGSCDLFYSDKEECWYRKCKDTPNCYYRETQTQLKAKEQECERLKKGLNLILTVQKNCKECPHQKLDVDVLVCDLDCATAFKKIAKSTLQKCEV